MSREHGWVLQPNPKRKNILVRDPWANMRTLAEAGEWKPKTGPQGRYWRRQVKVGDVREVKPAETKKTKPPGSGTKPGTGKNSPPSGSGKA